MSKQSTDELWAEVEELENEIAQNEYQIQLNQQKKAELTLRQKDVAEQQAELIHSTILKAGINGIANTDKILDGQKGIKTQVTAINKNLVDLNDSLKNSTQLEAVYKAKREQLEIDFTTQKNTLSEAINSLKNDLQKKTGELNLLEQKISSKKSELERMKIRYAIQELITGRYFFPAFLTFWTIFIVMYLVDGFPAFFSWIQSLMN